MIVRVSFEIESPVKCSFNEMQEWLKYELKDNYELSLQNPLSKTELDLNVQSPKVYGVTTLRIEEL